MLHAYAYRHILEMPLHLSNPSLNNNHEIYLSSRQCGREPVVLWIGISSQLPTLRFCVF